MFLRLAFGLSNGDHYISLTMQIYTNSIHSTIK
nr:MAG TPA: hypothetical protein [Caudoviricetes sp.]